MNERTFRGRSLAELVPQIKEELGDGAIAVRVREGRTGGIGGFFAQRCVEVDARGADLPEERPTAPAGPRFDQILDEAVSGTRSTHPTPAQADVPGTLDQLLADARQASESSAALAALFAPDAQPPAVQEPEAAAPEPAFEPDPVPAPVAPAPARSVALAEPAPAWPDEAGALHADLVREGLGGTLAADLVGEVVDHLLPFSSDAQLRPLVAAELARRMPVLPRRRPGGLVVGFVGAGGSGKTRCAARLALAYAKRGALPVACLALRPKDGGAELLSEVSHEGVPVHAAADAESARRFLDRVGGEALVVVDTPAVSPRAEAELRQLAAELRQLQLDEVHLVLPATTGPQAAAELVGGTRELGVGAVAISHTDETAHVGTAVSAALRAELPVSYLGRGAGSGSLRPALPEKLARQLVGA